MKKITFLLLHLGYGGVEKSVINLANILSENYQVELIVTYKIYEKSPFKLNDKVKVRYLLGDLKPNRNEIVISFKKMKIINIIVELTKAIKILYLRKKTMKDVVKQCNSSVIISTRILYNLLLSKYGAKDIIKIAQEHRHHNNNKIYIRRLVKSCYNIDYLMPVSQYLTDYYTNIFKNKKAKCIYISHFLDNIPEQVSMLKSKKIISIGRLSKEKGFYDLVQVFALVNKKHPEWELHIIGDGKEKEKIINEVQKHNIKDKVIMYGYQNEYNLKKILRNSSIYVMTSFEESFGLVLLEAASYGIPAVVFDSAIGAQEIIIHEENGYFVANRNKEEMANKIIYLIEHYEIRKELGQKSREMSFNYSVESVKKQWFNFLDKILVGEDSD